MDREDIRIPRYVVKTLAEKLRAFIEDNEKSFKFHPWQVTSTLNKIQKSIHSGLPERAIHHLHDTGTADEILRVSNQNSRSVRIGRVKEYLYSHLGINSMLKSHLENGCQIVYQESQSFDALRRNRIFEIRRLVDAIILQLEQTSKSTRNGCPLHPYNWTKLSHLSDVPKKQTLANCTLSSCLFHGNGEKREKKKKVISKKPSKIPKTNFITRNIKSATPRSIYKQPILITTAPKGYFSPRTITRHAKPKRMIENTTQTNSWSLKTPQRESMFEEEAMDISNSELSEESDSDFYCKSDTLNDASMITEEVASDFVPVSDKVSEIKFENSPNNIKSSRSSIRISKRKQSIMLLEQSNKTSRTENLHSNGLEATEGSYPQKISIELKAADNSTTRSKPLEVNSKQKEITKTNLAPLEAIIISKGVASDAAKSSKRVNARSSKSTVINGNQKQVTKASLAPLEAIIISKSVASDALKSSKRFKSKSSKSRELGATRKQSSNSNSVRLRTIENNISLSVPSDTGDNSLAHSKSEELAVTQSATQSKSELNAVQTIVNCKPVGLESPENVADSKHLESEAENNHDINPKFSEVEAMEINFDNLRKKRVSISLPISEGQYLNNELSQKEYEKSYNLPDSFRRKSIKRGSLSRCKASIHGSVVMQSDEGNEMLKSEEEILKMSSNGTNDEMEEDRLNMVNDTDNHIQSNDLSNDEVLQEVVKEKDANREKSSNSDPLKSSSGNSFETMINSDNETSYCPKSSSSGSGTENESDKSSIKENDNVSVEYSSHWTAEYSSTEASESEDDEFKKKFSDYKRSLLEDDEGIAASCEEELSFIHEPREIQVKDNIGSENKLTLLQRDKSFLTVSYEDETSFYMDTETNGENAASFDDAVSSKIYSEDNGKNVASYEEPTNDTWDKHKEDGDPSDDKTTENTEAQEKVENISLGENYTITGIGTQSCGENVSLNLNENKNHYNVVTNEDSTSKNNPQEISVKEISAQNEDSLIKNGEFHNEHDYVYEEGTVENKNETNETNKVSAREESVSDTEYKKSDDNEVSRENNVPNIDPEENNNTKISDKVETNVEFQRNIVPNDEDYAENFQSPVQKTECKMEEKDESIVQNGFANEDDITKSKENFKALEKVLEDKFVISVNNKPLSNEESIPEKESNANGELLLETSNEAMSLEDDQDVVISSQEEVLEETSSRINSQKQEENDIQVSSQEDNNQEASSSKDSFNVASEDEGKTIVSEDKSVAEDGKVSESNATECDEELSSHMDDEENVKNLESEDEHSDNEISETLEESDALDKEETIFDTENISSHMKDKNKENGKNIFNEKTDGPLKNNSASCTDFEVYTRNDEGLAREQTDGKASFLEKIESNLSEETKSLDKNEDTAQEGLEGCHQDAEEKSRAVALEDITGNKFFNQNDNCDTIGNNTESVQKYAIEEENTNLNERAILNSGENSPKREDQNIEENQNLVMSRISEEVEQSLENGNSSDSQCIQLNENSVISSIKENGEESELNITEGKREKENESGVSSQNEEILQGREDNLLLEADKSMKETSDIKDLGIVDQLEEKEIIDTKFENVAETKNNIQDFCGNVKEHESNEEPYEKVEVGLTEDAAHQVKQSESENVKLSVDETVVEDNIGSVKENVLENENKNGVVVDEQTAHEREEEINQDVEESEEKVDEDGEETRNTRLLNALSLNSTELFEDLDIMDENLLDMSDEDGMNMLHMAASKGMDSFVENLLRRGIPVDGLSRSGNTALQLAITNNHLNCCQVLLRQGANLASEDGSFNDSLIEEATNVSSPIKELLVNYKHNYLKVQKLVEVLNNFGSEKKNLSAPFSKSILQVLADVTIGEDETVLGVAEEKDS